MNQVPQLEPERIPEFLYSTNQNNYKFPYNINISHRPISKVKDSGDFYFVDLHPFLKGEGSKAFRECDHPLRAFWNEYIDGPICTLQFNNTHRGNFCFYRLAVAFYVGRINEEIPMAIHLAKYSDVINAVKYFLDHGKFDEEMAGIIKVECSMRVRKTMLEIEKNAKTYDPEFLSRANKIRKDYAADTNIINPYLVE